MPTMTSSPATASLFSMKTRKICTPSPPTLARLAALGLEPPAVRPQGLAHPHGDAGGPGIEAGDRVLDEVIIVGHQFPPPNLMRGSATA